MSVLYGNIQKHMILNETSIVNTCTGIAIRDMWMLEIAMYMMSDNDQVL